MSLFQYLRTLVHHDEGQDLLEYALLVALIALVAVGAITIAGTNVNTMVVPGFVAQVHTEFTRGESLLMPCHEYCGLGHSEMWAMVQVTPDDQFKPGPDGRVSCAQR